MNDHPPRWFAAAMLVGLAIGLGLLAGLAALLVGAGIWLAHH